MRKFFLLCFLAAFRFDVRWMLDRQVFCRIVVGKQKFLGARGKGVLRFAVLFLPAVEAKKRALEIKAGLTAEF